MSDDELTIEPKTGCNFRLVFHLRAAKQNSASGYTSQRQDPARAADLDVAT